VGPYQHGADRPVYIIAHGPDEQAVWKALQEAENTIRIET
jgi:hypothetical protein